MLTDTDGSDTDDADPADPAAQFSAANVTEMPNDTDAADTGTAEISAAEGAEPPNDADRTNTGTAEIGATEGAEPPYGGDLDCATSEPTPAESQSSLDPRSDGLPSLSDWLAQPRDPQTGESPTAAELSTGPRLQWTEIAAGPQETLGLEHRLRLEGTSVGGVARISLESSGDGRVLARVRDGGVRRYFFTSDGSAWTELPMPEGILALFVRGSGSTWTVVGYDPEDDTEREHANGVASILSTSVPAAPEPRVFASDDDGVHWIEVKIDVGPGTPHVIEGGFPASALLVSGECIIVPVALYRILDWSSLLSDRGLIDDGRLTGCWPHTEDSVLRCLVLNPDLEDETASKVAAALLDPFAAADPGGVVNQDDYDLSRYYDVLWTVIEALDDLPGVAYLEVVLDELDLTRDQQAVLMAHAAQAEMLAGASPTGLGFHPFGIADLVTTRVFVGGRSGLTPVADLPGWPYSSLATPGGFLLHVVGTASVIADSADGHRWRETPVDASPPLLAVSFTVLEPFATLQPLGGVAADGTVWGQVWADAGGLAMTALRIGEAPTVARVFEGLEPGPRLEGLAAGPAGLATAATRRWVDEEDQHHARTLVGWSADGAQWGWQSTAEAFGITDEYLGEMAVAVELAVGTDFVLALMEDNQDFTSYPLRWFIAPVPSRE